MTPQHSSHTQPYHPNIAAAFSTPPSTSEPLPPVPPDTLGSLRPYTMSTRGSASTPVTPLTSFPSRHQSPQQMYYSREDDGGARPMSIDAISHPPPRPGFRRVRDSRDLRPRVNLQPQGRRADPSGNGTFLSVGNDVLFSDQLNNSSNPT